MRKLRSFILPLVLSFVTILSVGALFPVYPKGDDSAVSEDKVQVEVTASCMGGEVTVYGNPGQHFYVRLYVDGALLDAFPSVATGETISVSWSGYPQIDTHDYQFFQVLVGGNTWSEEVGFGGTGCVTGVFIDEFYAVSGPEGVTVYWSTLDYATFLLRGFYVYRSETFEGLDKQQVNETMIYVDFRSFLFPDQDYTYEYLDTTPGNYYWLKEIFGDGSSAWTGPVVPE